MTTEEMKGKMDAAADLAIKELENIPERDLEVLGGWFFKELQDLSLETFG